MQLASDSILLAPLVQTCEDVGMRVEGLKKQMVAHINVKDLTASLTHTMEIFLMRGIMTLQGELDVEFANDDTSGELDKLSSTVSTALNRVYEV